MEVAATGSATTLNCRSAVTLWCQEAARVDLQQGRSVESVKTMVAANSVLAAARVSGLVQAWVSRANPGGIDDRCC